MRRSIRSVTDARITRVPTPVGMETSCTGGVAAGDPDSQ